MKIKQYVAVGSLIGILFCSYFLMAGTSEKQKTHQKKKVSAAKIRASAEKYIRNEMKLKDGYFLQHDEKENKTWRLLFEKIQKKVRRVKGGKYLVTAEFKTKDYEPHILELDFFMKKNGASFSPYKIKIRTVDGKPRYKYTRKGRKKSSAYKGLELAPDFSLLDLDGNTVTLSDFEGKVVILNFWATWCPPCKAEIPGFIELNNEYKNKGFEMIGISLDPDGAKAVGRFLEKYKINYTLILGNMKVSSVYGGIDAIPTSFIINRDGYIYKKYVGYRSKDVFEKDIKTLLRK